MVACQEAIIAAAEFTVPIRLADCGFAQGLAMPCHRLPSSAQFPRCNSLEVVEAWHD